MDNVNEDSILMYAQAQSAITLGRINSRVSKDLRSARFGIMDIHVDGKPFCFFAVFGPVNDRTGVPSIETVGVRETEEGCLEQIRAWFRVPIDNVTSVALGSDRDVKEVEVGEI